MLTLLHEDALNSLAQRRLQMRLIDEILALIDEEQS